MFYHLFWAKSLRIRWNNERKSKGKYWSKNKCYYYKEEGITNLKNHQKTCKPYLKEEKKSVRLSNQKYYGKKKVSKKKMVCKRKKWKFQLIV